MLEEILGVAWEATRACENVGEATADPTRDELPIDAAMSFAGR